MKENIEILYFLINQTEQRIQSVDVKASIILAFLGVLLTGSVGLDSFQTYFLGVWKDIFILYLLVMIFFLILTIRPVRNFNDLLVARRKPSPQGAANFWIEKIQDLEDFQIGDPVMSLEYMFGELSKRRILKYRYFRISMLMMRLLILFGIFFVLMKFIFSGVL